MAGGGGDAGAVSVGVVEGGEVVGDAGGEAGGKGGGDRGESVGCCEDDCRIGLVMWLWRMI